MTQNSRSGKWIALITGVFSILIGFIYLLLITLLDARGQMLPPPPEAMGVVGVVVSFLSW